MKILIVSVLALMASGCVVRVNTSPTIIRPHVPVYSVAPPAYYAPLQCRTVFFRNIYGELISRRECGRFY